MVILNSPADKPGDSWAASAAPLGVWTMGRMANRTDCRGGYRPPEEIGREFARRDDSKGKLGSQTTRKGKLTLRILERHYAARSRADIVGLHTTSTANTSLWGALDIDVHEGSIVSPEITQRAAIHWFEALRGRGFHPLLTSSNGKGGYHLRLLFETPAPTADVFHYLQQLVSDYQRHGLTAPPETFPKQPCIEPGQFGNWLRLPGKHHTREHWSEIWDGERWLAGEDAIAFILSLEGDPASLIPPAPPQRPTPPSITPFRPVPDGSELSRRISAYLAKLPRLSAGQGRDGVAFAFSAFLQRDLALSIEDALPWLLSWDAGNNPPKGEEALREIAGNALKYGKSPIGNGLAVQPYRVRRHGVIRTTVEI